MQEIYSRSWSTTPKLSSHASNWPSVSVIVAARNEVARIRPTLEALVSQAYPGQLEFLIIDDHSSDGTGAIVQDYTSSRLHLLSANGFGKRAALSTGILASSGEIILLTDADCVMDSDWVSTMTIPFNTSSLHWLSGPVVTSPGNRLVSQVDSLEWQGLMAITGASFNMGRPVLAQGANTAFRRATFDQIGGFGSFPNKASGDDVLLLARFLQLVPGGCKFQKDIHALVKTKPPGSWSELVLQRLRWTSKTTTLSGIYVKGPMILTFITSLVVLIIPILLLVLPSSLHWLALAPFFVKIIADYRLLRTGWMHTDMTPGVIIFIAASFLHPAIVFLSGIIGPIRPGYYWKERKVK